MFPWSELKHLFTYSPIHFLLFTTPNNWQKITKFSCENDFLCTTKVHAPCILSGNKMKKTENFLWSELKDLFTYSPIHLFSSLSPCLEIKWKMDSFPLVRVKTPIHLFTYSPFCSHLSIRHFRHVGPKQRWSLPAHQNWAYATKPTKNSHTATYYPKLCWCTDIPP